MNKLISLSLVLGLVLAPGISQAKKSRTDSGEYNTIIISPDEDSPNVSGEYSNGVVFTPRKGERFVEIVLEDQLGMPTRAIVTQDYDGDGQDEVAHEICGATERPIKFRKGVDITVLARSQGLATTGRNRKATASDDAGRVERRSLVGGPVRWLVGGPRKGPVCWDAQAGDQGSNFNVAPRLQRRN